VKYPAKGLSFRKPEFRNGAFLGVEVLLDAGDGVRIDRLPRTGEALERLLRRQAAATARQSLKVDDRDHRVEAVRGAEHGAGVPVNGRSHAAHHRFAITRLRQAETHQRGWISQIVADPRARVRLAQHLLPAAFVPVRLEFDRGTITLSGCSEREVAGLPGVLWDPRVQVYRAPGHRYSALKAALTRSGRAIQDRVSCGDPLPARHWKAPSLRSYQSAALASWELSKGRGMVVLPTGSGKTRVAVGAMAMRRNRALCLAPTRILLEQWRALLGESYSGPIGQYGDGMRTLEAVTVATFASAFHHMEILGNRFDLLVVDEAHHFGTGANDEILELCTAPARIGLTGTPPTNHLQRARIEELIGPVVTPERLQSGRRVPRAPTDRDAFARSHAGRATRVRS